MVTFVPPHRSDAVGGSKSHARPHSTIRLETHVSTGGVVSMMVMVWLQVAELLQLSVACQVRVCAKVLPHSGVTMLVRTTIVTFVPSAMSSALGASKSH